MSQAIAIISEQTSPLASMGEGGPTESAASLACLVRQLSLAGYTVDVFTRRTAPDQPELMEWLEGVRVVHVTAGPSLALPVAERLSHMPAFTTAVGAWCRARRYPLLHAISWLSGLVAAEIKRQVSIPFVVTLHGLGRAQRRHGWSAAVADDGRVGIEQRLVAEADAIIVTCPRDQEDLLCLYGADSGAITVIPDGFDPDEVWPMSKPLARAALGLPPGERLLVHVGAPTPGAGADTAIRGLGRLVRRHGLPARLLLVGDGSAPVVGGTSAHRDHLQAIAAGEGVTESVIFADWRQRDRLRFYYSAADVLMATPWETSRGLSAMEAMACGTPVVGSDVGGIAYAVRDGETGYLVSPGQPDQVAERLAHLYAHPRLVEALSRQAIRRVHAAFAWPRVIWAITDLYDQVLAGRTHEAAFLSRQRVVEHAFDEAAAVLQGARRRLRRSLVTTAEAIAACLARGSALLIAAEGESAAIARHLAGEFVARAHASGHATPRVITLADDPGLLVASTDERGAEEGLARQIADRGRTGDILLLIGAGERSRGLLPAARTARRLGLHMIALLDDDDETARAQIDVPLRVAASHGARVHEAHLVIAHVLGQLIELELRERRQEWQATSASRVRGPSSLTRPGAQALGHGHRPASEHPRDRPAFGREPSSDMMPHEAGP